MLRRSGAGGLMLEQVTWGLPRSSRNEGQARYERAEPGQPALAVGAEQW